MKIKDYYDWIPGIECIQVTRHFGFNLGNAIKYIWRCGKKPGNDAVYDLKKAIDYLQDEIDRLNAEYVKPENDHVYDSAAYAVGRSKLFGDFPFKWNRNPIKVSRSVDGKNLNWLEDCNEYCQCVKEEDCKHKEGQLTLVSDNEETVRIVEEYDLASGFNPFDYDSTGFDIPGLETDGMSVGEIVDALLEREG